MHLRIRPSRHQIWLQDELTYIDRQQEENRRWVAEQHKLMAEQQKRASEAAKVAEAAKPGPDGWLTQAVMASVIVGVAATFVPYVLKGLGVLP